MPTASRSAYTRLFGTRVRHHRRARRVGRRWTAATRRGFPAWSRSRAISGCRSARALALLLRLAVRDQRPASTSAIRSPAGHLRARPRARRARDCARIGASIVDHLRFRHPKGEAAKRYNVLQKLAYLGVIFVLLPLIVLMGLAMSPRLDTRRSAAGSTLRRPAVGAHDPFHRRVAAGRAFVLVHVFEVIVTGLWNNLRSMITGRYRASTPEDGAHEASDERPDATRRALSARRSRQPPARWRSPAATSCRRRAWFREGAGAGERLNRGAQHALLGRKAMAQEFTEADLSPTSAATARAMPDNAAVPRARGERLRRLALKVDGLVRAPREFSLAELRAHAAPHADHPPRLRRGLERDRQVEGRAACRLLDAVQPKPTRATSCSIAPTRWTLDGRAYYESIDMDDAFHPQTILAYELNDRPLPVPTARRCGCASSGSSATSRRSTSCASSWSRASRHRRRQGRLLGRPRLPVVRGHLSGGT